MGGQIGVIITEIIFFSSFVTVSPFFPHTFAVFFHRFASSLPPSDFLLPLSLASSLLSCLFREFFSLSFLAIPRRLPFRRADPSPPPAGYRKDQPYSEVYKLAIVVWIMMALGYWFLLLNFLQKALKSNVPRRIKKTFRSKRIAKQAEFFRQLVGRVSADGEGGGVRGGSWG